MSGCCEQALKKATKDEIRTMMVKVVEPMRKCEEQELLITSMEKEVKDVEDGCRFFNSTCLM